MTMTATSDTIDTMDVMRHQEETEYRTTDYLASSSRTKTTTCVLDTNSRSKMVTWCYQVVDFCNFHREIVQTAVNYLDRFCATNTAGAATVRADLHMFQLAAMTCLYTAVKIHEPESSMNPAMISVLSNGDYSEEQVENMEFEILSALRWLMNPPTALAFLRCYLNLISEKVLERNIRDAVYEIAKFQTELAIGSFDLAIVKPSIIAYCSVVNAMQRLIIDETIVQRMTQIMSQAAGIDITDEESIRHLQGTLFELLLIEQSSLEANGNMTMTETKQHCTVTAAGRQRTISMDNVSPRSANLS